MKKDIVVATIAALLVIVACFALAMVRPDRPLTPSHPFVAESAAAAARPKPEGKVVMHINGEPITQKEFEAFVLNAPEEARMFYTSPDGRRYLAEELIKLKVLQQEAEKRGLDKKPEVRSQLELVRAQIMASKALQAVVTERVDERIKAEYAKDKSTALGLRHILVSYQGAAIPARDPKKPALTVEQAMQKANGIVAQLRGGADFSRMAFDVSDDTQSASQGGEIGATTPDQLPPDIGAAVKKLKPGQISDPVKTQFGVHIFKVETPTLEQMRPALTQKLQQQVAKETLEQLRKGATVDFDPSYFPQPKPGAEPAAVPRPRSNG